MRDHVSDEILAQKRQVAHHVEDLVSHGLVGEPQLVVDRAVGSKHEQVRFRGPPADARLPQRLRLGFQQERAARRQHVTERFGTDFHESALGSDRRFGAVIEVVREHEPVAVSRVGRERGLAVPHGDRPIDRDHLTGTVLLDRAGVAERFDECAARTVAAGDFRCVDLDLAVIDAQSRKRGHDVLDELHDRLALLQGRPPLARDDPRNVRGSAAAQAGRRE